MVSSSTDQIIGLGNGALETLEIEWPVRDRTPLKLRFPSLRDRLLCIDRTDGVVPCR